MCRQRRRHQKRVASGPCHQLSLSESAAASPLFECAIVGICDDDEHAFLESPETDGTTRRRMMGIVSGI